MPPRNKGEAGHLRNKGEAKWHRFDHMEIM